MRMGLVSEVTDPAALMTTALKLAQAIASQPALAVQTTLRAIWAAHELSAAQAMSMAPRSSSTG